ncbi:hypothetical protein TNCV_3541011 [Trichonephila clavipes]|nr:hypothetical protein TNCV_3541011 [Trichonephila clavipes]
MSTFRAKNVVSSRPLAFLDESPIFLERRYQSFAASQPFARENIKSRSQFTDLLSRCDSAYASIAKLIGLLLLAFSLPSSLFSAFTYLHTRSSRLHVKKKRKNGQSYQNRSVPYGNRYEKKSYVEHIHLWVSKKKTGVNCPRVDSTAFSSQIGREESIVSFEEEK